MKVVERDEVGKSAITTVLEEPRLQLTQVIHLKTADKADLHAESSVLAGAVEAYEDTVVDGDPLRAGSATLEAHAVRGIAQPRAFDGIEHKLTRPGVALPSLVRLVAFLARNARSYRLVEGHTPGELPLGSGCVGTDVQAQAGRVRNFFAAVQLIRRLAIDYIHPQQLRRHDLSRILNAVVLRLLKGVVIWYIRSFRGNRHGHRLWGLLDGDQAIILVDEAPGLSLLGLVALHNRRREYFLILILDLLRHG